MLTELWGLLTSIRPKIPEFLENYFEMATPYNTESFGVNTRGVPLQVLNPQNQIAVCFTQEKNTIEVFNENLQKFVESVPPEWRDAPMVTLCALGSDDGSTATLLTNWLIHYYQNSKSKTFTRNIESGLDYVGTPVTGGNDQGLYLWPVVFHDGQLYAVLYANSQRLEVFDILCALSSSVIVTACKQPQKDKIVKFMKAVLPGNVIPRGTRFVDVAKTCQKLSAHKNGEQSAFKEAWAWFFDALEKEPLIPHTFERGILTPSYFRDFIYRNVSILNSNQSQIQSLFLPKKQKTLAEASLDTLEKGKVIVPNTASGAIPKDNQLVEQQKNNKTSGHVYAVLEEWIFSQMDISTIDNILTSLEDKDVNSYPEVQANILGLHGIIKRFNEDLLKMHDNYVCFQGDRDKQQRTRFQNSACDAALRSFQSTKFTSEECTVIFEIAKSRLLDIYQNDDKRIQNLEIDLANMIAQDVTSKYKEKLMEYSKQQKLTKAEFQEIHQRMTGQCVSIIGKTMNYGGSLNNIVKISTKLATDSMDKFFNRMCEKTNFEPVLTTPTVPPRTTLQPNNPLVYYDKQIKELLAKHGGSNTQEFKEENDKVIQKVLGSTTGSDRDELEIRLRTHLGFVDELHEQAQGQAHADVNPSTIAMLITSRWVWLAVNAKLLKFQLINWNNDKGISCVGFPAEIAWLSSQLIYGHTVKKMPDCDPHGRIINFICDESDTGRKMIAEFFTKIKLELDEMANERTDRLFLVLPSWLGINDRNLLRDCGKRAGFQKLILLTEPSVSAYYTIWKFPNATKPNILVVAAAEDAIRLEIFRQEDVGVQLLAVAYEVWPIAKRSPNSKLQKTTEKLASFTKAKLTNGSMPDKNMEVVDATYGRVLAQIIPEERKLVTHYVLLSETAKWANDLDKYFQTKAGLTKVDNIDKGETFLEVFSHFASNAQTILKFVETLATIPLRVNATPFSENKTPKIPSHGRNTAGGVKALLERCESIERQLEAGTVQVSNLTKKIILQAVNRAKVAAEQNMTTGQEVEHINEIFVKYNFKD